MPAIIPSGRISPRLARTDRVPSTKRTSVPQLPLMPHRQDDHPITRQAIQGRVTTVTNINKPLAVLGFHVSHEATYTGLVLHQHHALANGRGSPPGCLWVVWGQESIKALNVFQCLLRPDQLWSSGGSTSWPCSSCASQSSACAAVACSPVRWWFSLALMPSCR
jgi:hypothetical protein